MSQQNEEPIDLVVQENGSTQVSFLRKGSEFDKLSKSLGKVSQKAIDKLLELTESEDEKTAYNACKTLLEMDVAVSKERVSESLQRLVAHARFNSTPNVKQLVNADEKDSRPKPIIDFGTVRSLD